MTVLTRSVTVAKPTLRYRTSVQPLAEATVQNKAILPQASMGQLLRFGENGRNGLWITPEFPPAKSGGLGQVSLDIPVALNQHLGKDIRILAPLLKPIWDEAVENGMLNKPAEEGGLERTGLQTTLLLPGWTQRLQEKPTQTFELWQQKDPKTGLWKYFVAQANVNTAAGNNDEFFGTYKDLYMNGASGPYSQDAMFKANMLFSTLAAQFAPMLDKSFDDKTPNDVVLAHDWLSGPVLHQMAPTYANRVGKVFMLHNFFDQPRTMEYATQQGLINITRDPYVPNSTTPSQLSHFSPLSSGIAQSDVVIADKNFVQSIVTDRISGNIPAIPYLQNKLAQNKVYSVEHTASPVFDAFTNPALNSPGFMRLKSLNPSDIAEYKQTNKRGVLALFANEEAAPAGQSPSLAVPKLLPVAEGQKPIIYTLTSRLDAAQKGFKLVMDTAEAFMEQHADNPNIRFIISALGSDPHLEADIVRMQQRIKANPKLNGKMTVTTKSMKDHFFQLVAGSDISLMPSTYEPYGVVQKEAMALLTMPLASNVDGLASTLVDPAVTPNAKGQAQTALLFNFTNRAQYLQAMWNWIDRSKKRSPAFAPLWKLYDTVFNRADRVTIQTANQTMLNALNRSYDLMTKHPSRYLEILANGRRAVDTKNWTYIAQNMYTPIINAAVQAAKQRTGDTITLNG